MSNNFKYNLQFNILRTIIISLKKFDTVAITEETFL